MTEETTTLTGQAPPPVRDWPALDLDGTDFAQHRRRCVLAARGRRAAR
ncbi:hypothetical protein OHT76_37230 [Streptomyces sp. NBC_00287]|nr:hypothetical protein [Streptomyces sp. NBC_00287]